MAGASHRRPSKAGRNAKVVDGNRQHPSRWTFHWPAALPGGHSNIRKWPRSSWISKQCFPHSVAAPDLMLVTWCFAGGRGLLLTRLDTGSRPVSSPARARGEQGHLLAVSHEARWTLGGRIRAHERASAGRPSNLRRSTTANSQTAVVNPL